MVYIVLIMLGMSLAITGGIGLIRHSQRQTMEQLAAAKSPETPPALVTDQFSDNDYETAALKLIIPKLAGEYVFHTMADVERQRERTAKLRQWATLIENIHLRNAIIFWLDTDDMLTKNKFDSWNKYHDDKSDYERQMERDEHNAKKLLEIIRPPSP